MKFRVCECKKCKYQSIYYAPDYLSDEDIEKEFEVKIVDGKMIDICSICGEEQIEIPIEQWDIDTLHSVIFSMMEDDNHHNLTEIGVLFDNIMKDANISETQRRLALQKFVEYYDSNHSLKIK